MQKGLDVNKTSVLLLLSPQGEKHQREIAAPTYCAITQAFTQVGVISAVTDTARS